MTLGSRFETTIFQPSIDEHGETTGRADVEVVVAVGPHQDLGIDAPTDVSFGGLEVVPVFSGGGLVGNETFEKVVIEAGAKNLEQVIGRDLRMPIFPELRLLWNGHQMTSDEVKAGAQNLRDGRWRRARDRGRAKDLVLELRETVDDLVVSWFHYCHSLL